MFHIERDTSVSKVNLKVHIYHDEKRKVDEVDTLFKRICEIEKDVASKKFRCREDVRDFIEGCLRGGSRIFEITGTAPSFNLKRRVKAISRLINRMGRMILITNKISLEKEEILSFYKKKDKLEKMFDVMKNEITSGRLRVRSQHCVEGRIFITFVSLILYSELHRIMKEKELYSKYAIPEVLFELKKLRVVKMTNGKEYLTEVSKKQRTLFEKFEVPVPVGT
jgi:transposase